MKHDEHEMTRNDTEDIEPRKKEITHYALHSL